MKLISYSWVEGSVVGEAKIQCECGEVFEYDSLDGESYSDPDSAQTVECPKCGITKKFRLHMEFIFEDVGHGLST
jgi:hypothetical protein